MSVSSPFLSASPSILARFTAQQPVLPSPMPAIWRPFSRFARSFPMPSPPSVFPRPSPALRGSAQFLPIICSFPMPCPLCTATQLVRPTKSNRCARPATRPEHPPRSSYCILPTTCLSPCLRRFVQRPNWPGTSRSPPLPYAFAARHFPAPISLARFSERFPANTPHESVSFPAPPNHSSAPYSVSSLLHPLPRAHLPVCTSFATPAALFRMPVPSFPMPVRSLPCPPILSYTRPAPTRSPLSLLLDQLVVFSPRKRPNRRYGAGGEVRKGRPKPSRPTTSSKTPGRRNRLEASGAEAFSEPPRTVDLGVLSPIFRQHETEKSGNNPQTLAQPQTPLLSFAGQRA